MIPHTPKAIAFLAQRLFTHVLPDVRTNFGAADVAFIGLLFEMVGQDFERAAHARLEDIREMRAIFAAALALALDPALAARVDEALARDLGDVRISALDEAHAQHSAVLIDVHARIETHPGEAAERIDRQVWEHLERHAERHRYDVNF